MLQYAELHSECPLVFFGDNGQGDVVAAERALESKTISIHAAFIHQVQELAVTTTTLGHLALDKRQKRWDELGIFFVRTPSPQVTDPFVCPPCPSQLD